MTFTFPRIAVAAGRASPVTLTVATDDPDGDPVTVTWAVTRGLLENADQGTPSMRWTVSNLAGTDTITVTAEDGKGGQAVIKPVVLVVNRVTQPTGGNVTWSKTGSPYLMAPSAGSPFAVGIGVKLTIEAGVQLIVDTPDMELLVGGTFITQGTAAEPVSFVYNAVTPERGAWAGITGKPEGAPPSVSLTYTHISHATNGVKALGSSVVSVTNCKIGFCSEAAVLHNGTAALNVINSVITNNDKSGVRIDETVSGLPASTTIRGDSIAFNGDLTGGTVYANGEAGISINLNDAQATVPITIEDNHISINGFPGIRLTGGSFPTITNNAIFGNERNKNPAPRYNLRLEPGFNGPGSTSEIDATNNYWAQLDSLEIGQRIYDRRDNASIETTVLYSPWLTSAP